MECPKCGRKSDDGAFICPGCDFILDASFLGDDITDDDRAIRRAPVRASKKHVDFGEDAMILGDAAERDWSDFHSRDAGVSQREVTQARFYIGGSTAQLLHPDAVPEVVPNAVGAALRLTPFEKHLLDFINGKRSVGRIQKKSGMEDSEFKTSLAMLSDKGVIRLRTMKKRKKGAPSSMQASVSEQRAEIPEFDVSDRTVVAPPPSEAAEPPRAVPSRERSRVSARPPRVPEDDGATDLALPRSSRTAPLEETDARALGKGAFRSLKAESEAQSEEPEPRRSMRDVWGSGTAPANSSNIFARAKAKKKEPSLAEHDVEAPEPANRERAKDERDNDEGEEKPNAFTESVRARLRPITGEDVAVPEQPSLLPGAPLDDDDLLFSPGSGEGAIAAPQDEGEAAPEADASEGAPRSAEGADFDVPTGPRRPMVTSNTMTREVERHARADRADERALAALPQRQPARTESTNARDESNVETGPLPRSAASADAEPPRAQPPAIPSDDDDEGPEGDEDVGFDVNLHTATADRLSKQRTASLPGSIPELPSEALMPIPSAEAQKAPAPAVVAPPPAQPAPLPAYVAPQAAPPLALPGQSLARPSPSSAVAPAPATAHPAAHAPSAPTAGSRPGGARPGIPGSARPSAASSVPFEQARKAEKIFEQAQKDYAEGRLSSARMNAKLAVQFDSSVAAYKDFLALLDQAAAGQKAAPVKPRELILFEQAQDAEGRGEYEKAVKLLKEAVQLSPKSAQLHNKLGVVLSIRLKRHDEALKHLKSAIEYEPGSLVYMNNYSKVTAALESQRDRDPEEKKGRGRMDKDAKVEIKKIRPKMF